MKFHPLYSIIRNLTLDRRHKWFCKIFWNSKMITFPNGDFVTTKDLWNNEED